MSEAMELSEQQLNQIGGYVKQNLGAWLTLVVTLVTAASTAITILLGS